MTLTNILQLIFALALLFLGRKLYWVFVGAVGFIAVTEVVLTQFSIQQEWLVVLIGLAAGILGAVLAIFVRMVGIGLAGVLGGVYVFHAITRLASIQNPTFVWVLLILGAIAGFLLVLLLLDWALITISSLTGSILLTELVGIPNRYGWLMILALLAVGILVQSRMLPTAEDGKI